MVKWRVGTRGPFPHPDVGNAKIEPIHQPIYSTAFYNNAAISAQRELFFFRYSEGQVPGDTSAAAAVASTALETSMQTAGFLASPKVFLVTGARIVIPNIAATAAAVLSDSSQGVEDAVADDADEVLEIMYGTYFRFFVGVKDYINVPTWCVPGNTGVAGLASVSIAGVATNGPDIINMTSANGVGRPFSLGEQPVLIANQQNFFTSLNSPQANVIAPTVERRVVSILDGILGREVM